eukprot:TRINITY_DN2680_c0_g8_i2.p1 TRINITY_DN2680_c0_g8~~TRINITY_DN2680_c0_g8_i2.p1  ORF type:complete len:103 (-),score=10.71 TRINITY_DN2680_c0_g8_i2:157-465(-)
MKTVLETYGGARVKIAAVSQAREEPDVHLLVVEASEMKENKEVQAMTPPPLLYTFEQFVDVIVALSSSPVAPRTNSPARARTTSPATHSTETSRLRRSKKPA